MTPEQDALQHAEQLYLTALDYQAWQSMEIDELRQKLADKDAEIERRYSDAMIGHRWFETRFGKNFNGRDFAVKCPMADEAIAEQEHDMRQMVEALKNIAGASCFRDIDWAQDIAKTALRLMKKGD